MFHRFLSVNIMKLFNDFRKRFSIRMLLLCVCKRLLRRGHSQTYVDLNRRRKYRDFDGTKRAISLYWSRETERIHIKKVP